MLKSHLTAVFRTLRRSKGYTAINVGGLAVGLAACLVIGLWVEREWSYDDFHEAAERTYRLVYHYKLSADHEGTTYPFTPSALAPALEERFPQVEQTVRVAKQAGSVVQRGARSLTENALYQADSTFFEAFSFPLVEGRPEDVLDRPRSLVLTQRAVETYFPDTQHPVGKTLRVDGNPHTVTGVAQNLPPNTHFDFGMVASFPSDAEPRWYPNEVTTYVRLAEGATPRVLEAPLTALVNERKGADDEPDREYATYLQPIAGVHLGTGLPPGVELTDRNLSEAFGGTGNATYVYVFAGLAVFILLIACVNFTNLATARQVERAQEVGLRKALGARRSTLAGRFLAEAVLMSVVALMIAVGLARLALPALGALTDASLSLGALWSPRGLLAAGGAALATGLLAGAYPAFSLSRPTPTDALRGRTLGPGGQRLRQGLIVFQFAASVALIIGTGVAVQQLGYLRSRALGFDEEQVLLVEVPEHATSKGQPPLPTQALSALPGVERVSMAHSVPGESFFFTNYRVVGEGSGGETSLYQTWGDYDYAETLGLRVKRGRGFARPFASDSSAVLLNETAARQLFGKENPIGKEITPTGPSPYPRTVIGVVEDFNYQSLRREVKPLAIQFLEFPDYWPAPGVMALRLRPEDAQATLADIERTWQETVPRTPLSFSFLDDRLDAQYRTEGRLGRLFAVFAGLAVLIACLGLFGLAAFAAERRRKEIAVRKVLGATAAQMVALLSKDFLKLVALGFAVAAPLAYIAMRHWLDGFAYRVDLSPLVFVAAGVLALLVALLATGAQALRAAQANPAQALRDE